MVKIIIVIVILWPILEKLFDFRTISLRYKLLIILIALCYGVYDWNKNRVNPDKIYLGIWSGTKDIIRLNRDKKSISYFEEILKDKPVQLKFVLIQDNINSPEITQIFITFPKDSVVKPISDRSRSWERTNSLENEYSYNWYQPAPKGKPYNLPYFDVAFQAIDEDKIFFEYSIIGNGMEKIRRSFIIDTIKKFERSQKATGDGMASGIIVCPVSPDTSLIH